MPTPVYDASGKLTYESACEVLRGGSIIYNGTFYTHPSQLPPKTTWVGSEGKGAALEELDAQIEKLRKERELAAAAAPQGALQTKPPDWSDAEWAAYNKEFGRPTALSTVAPDSTSSTRTGPAEVSSPEKEPEGKAKPKK
jgi:hypothetical protein